MNESGDRANERTSSKILPQFLHERSLRLEESLKDLHVLDKTNKTPVTTSVIRIGEQASEWAQPTAPPFNKE